MTIFVPGFDNVTHGPGRFPVKNKAMANYFQDFNISEMANAIGMVPGEKREYEISVIGSNYVAVNDSYVEFHVEKIRITEAKNGHTTLKVWGRWFFTQYAEHVNEWYRNNTVQTPWHGLHPDTLRKIQSEISK